MTLALVLLQHPLGPIDRVRVQHGAETIERATGLRPDHIARLADDDREAILRAMLPHSPKAKS